MPSKLPILMELSTPLPHLPDDPDFAYHGHKRRESLKGELRKSVGICAYCGRPAGHTANLDHLIPKSRGGGNWRGNLALACLTCNRAKRDRTPSEWLDDLRAGIERLTPAIPPQAAKETA